MVQKYLDKLSKIVNEALSGKISKTDLLFKHFFSGAAVYAYDKIFCTYTPSGIALKLPSKEMVKLIKSDKGSELRYFVKSPVKKDYIVLGSEIIENNDDLNYWIRMAFNYAKSS